MSQRGFMGRRRAARPGLFGLGAESRRVVGADTQAGRDAEASNERCLGAGGVRAGGQEGVAAGVAAGAAPGLSRRGGCAREGRWIGRSPNAPRCLVSSESRWFRKTGCDVGAVRHKSVSQRGGCYSDGGERLRARELGDGLGALGHGVLGELAGSMRRTDAGSRGTRASPSWRSGTAWRPRGRCARRCR